MRYYELELNVTGEEIRENNTVHMLGYSKQDPIEALNDYMYRNMKNGMTFFGYREENSKISCAFAIDEQIWSYDDVVRYLSDELRRDIGIKRIEMPNEITMQEFLECILECRRRGWASGYASSYIDFTVVVFEYLRSNDPNILFDLKERIIQENTDVDSTKAIFDQSVLREFENISTHENTSDFKGNLVHYAVSSHSLASAETIIEALTQRLAKANRLQGRRIEIIREISPVLYKSCDLENIIENNLGGVIVIDLSERLGCSSVEYGMVCMYLEKLVKKYKNDCLFIFTYNIDNPGFSYQFFNLIRKHVIMLNLKEGTGDKEEAALAIKEQLKTSEYVEYADQVDKFMENISAERFTQTDVIEASEQFELWCLNKNVLQGYDYAFSDSVLLDRDENTVSAYDQLSQMIGLSTVKKQINNIIATDIVEKERKKRQGNAYEIGTMHMIFSGNPGTAKTTVARLFAGIAKEKGILKSGAFVERGGMDFNGLGCYMAIREAFIEAKGGVLFIDEAYAMTNAAAVTILIQELENHRDEVIVILAGYSEKMNDFMEINEGLLSRIPYKIDFPDYNAEELSDIFKLMLKEKGFSTTEDALKEARNIFEKAIVMDNFGNGRYVRNLIEHAAQNQSVRLLTEKKNAEEIEESDLFLLTREDISVLNEGLTAERTAGSARKELDEMIGLSAVKKIIYKAIANYKFKKMCMDKGIRKDKPSLHMVFSGNPGTAKTTVARLLAEIMKDEKLLSSGNFVEVGRADLIGKVVGETAPLVKKRFKEAQGGILFIDEAYSLCDGYANGYGDEAINTLVQEMENHREDVIVIFAGYPEQMQQFIERNPGLASRIAFHVNFEDYSTKELCDITKLMLDRKQMRITNGGMLKLEKLYDSMTKRSDFGNGRFVRKMLEEAEMNLAERIEQYDESQITIELITLIEEIDIPELDIEQHQEKPQIGFHAA